MMSEVRASLCILGFFTAVTGVGYPLLMTGLGQTFFPHQANGSLIEENERIIGSELIGQDFPDDRYFHSRPSAAGAGYDASNSSGSNLAPTSLDLQKTIKERVEEIRKSGETRAIPIDLITASASGLDPDISVSAAIFQTMRISALRGISAQELQNLITHMTKARDLHFLGEKRVNVLSLNRALDELQPAPPPTLPSPPVTNP